MSLLGKIFLSLSGFSFIIMTSATWTLGGWLPALNIFLGIFIIGFILSLAFDYKLYLGFLLMRTTKNGMSMGVSILITLIFCSALAYLSVQFEQSLDITEEKINSLSPQTVKILNSLTEEMKLVVFYKGHSAIGSQKRALIKRNLVLFKRATSKIKDTYHDAHLENKLAQEYLNEIPTKKGEDIFLFVEYKGKKVLVDFPFDEEKLSTAMIKVSRREQKTIYFLTGHGEKDFGENQTGSGIHELKKALQRGSFNVQTWNFVTQGPPPKNTSALAIIGPERSYIKKELEMLEEYLNKGGKLLLALDPDKKHNFKNLLKKFGIDYKPYYIMDPLGQGMRLGLSTAIGMYFDTNQPITSSFQQGSMTVFHMASHLKPYEKDSGFSVTSIVRTNPRARLVPSLESAPKEGEKSSYNLAVVVEKEQHSEEKKEEHSEEKHAKEKETAAEASPTLVIFGDSDFLSNNFINTGGANRDLALNSISYLVDEGDLLSIRPKKLKATQLILKQYDQMAMVLLAVVLPILFFIISFIIWMRRRGA